MISGLLLIWLGLLQFPLPFAVRASGTARSDKDLSTPFPCMNRPCGCRSAEDCWTSCCCTTKAERIAFVLDNGLEMPAALEEAEETPAAPRSCCSAGSKVATCELHPDQKEKPACAQCERPAKPVRNGLVLLSSALKCKGLTSLLVQFGGAVVPTAPCAPELVPVAEGLLTLTDDLRTGVTLSPPSPPPRLAG